MDEKETRAYVNELLFLQREINFLQKAAQRNNMPSLEKTIDNLRNSQTQLYEALTQHGITAEAVHQIIMENSDKQLVNEIMRLQAAKDKINKQLAEPNLSPQKRQSREYSLIQTTQAHREKWDEIINNPRRTELIHKVEQAQIKQLQRETRTRDHDRTHTLDRTR